MKELKNSVDTNREKIELYLVSEEGTVELSEKQKELLKRWTYVDEIIRQKEIRKRETQASMIMNHFGVSRQTAYQDIVNAEAVFASSTPLNKRYRIQARIEFLECKIDELYNNLEPDPDPDTTEDVLERVYRIRQNKEYIFEATQLEKVLAKYYEMYPDITPKRSPKKIVFNVNFSSMPAAPMTAEEALRKAGKIIDITPNDNNGAAE